MSSYQNFLSSLLSCSKCPRLVQHRNSFPQNYWRKPVPPNGDLRSRIVIVGLAPAGNGGNRTGRVFTGDESSNNLTKALYDTGLANQPYSVSRDDGLKLNDVYITAVVKCVPPENKPTTGEIRNCMSYLEEETRMLTEAKVYVALGKVAWDSLINLFKSKGYELNGDRKFSHGKIVKLVKDGNIVYLIGSYHPSPRNVRTRRLTIEMLEEIFETAKSLL
ncbi:uracil-DNA glycosylase [Sulfolobus acidocaldarius]|uniref:uracil-DNA glycosylase n=1 Tax=Sulfolobus acidocaldarius TaxID=2285 RepID=UPI0009B5D0FF|nr:uracil-DNA glycosylase [Sulfolobus acidocaldarius]WCM35570.1 uracil-DNA glycosylase [Sulfolobus acidocaldarius DSM 639]